MNNNQTLVDLSFYVYFVSWFIPLILAFGVFGTSICLLILIHDFLRNTCINVFTIIMSHGQLIDFRVWFIALSVTDLLCLLVGLTDIYLGRFYLIFRTGANIYPADHSMAVCYLLKLVLYFGLLLSTWIQVFISLLRAYCSLTYSLVQHINLDRFRLLKKHSQRSRNHNLDHEHNNQSHHHHQRVNLMPRGTPPLSCSGCATATGDGGGNLMLSPGSSMHSPHMNCRMMMMSPCSARSQSQLPIIAHHFFFFDTATSEIYTRNRFSIKLSARFSVNLISITSFKQSRNLLIVCASCVLVATVVLVAPSLDYKRSSTCHLSREMSGYFFYTSLIVKTIIPTILLILSSVLIIRSLRRFKHNFLKKSSSHACHAGILPKISRQRCNPAAPAVAGGSGGGGVISSHNPLRFTSQLAAALPTATASISKQNRRKNQQRISIVLLCMNLTFVIFAMPFELYMLLKSSEIWSHPLDTPNQGLPVQYLLNIWSYVNNATNWIFYLLLGAQFRTRFKRVFSVGIRKCW